MRLIFDVKKGKLSKRRYRNGAQTFKKKWRTQMKFVFYSVLFFLMTSGIALAEGGGVG